MLSAFLPFVIGYIVFVVVVSTARFSDPPTADELVPLITAGVVLLGLVFVTAALIIAWYVKVATELNEATTEPFNAGLWAILLIVPIAGIVSWFKLAAHIEAAQRARGVSGLPSVALFLLLWLVVLLGLPLAQVEINKVWRREGRGNAGWFLGADPEGGAR